MVDLPRYLARLSYQGPTHVGVETLHALSRAHVEAIPFENLDVLLQRPIDLSPSAVDDKLLGGRGGYCFEQNTLMLRVLQQLGFSARAISARVRIDRSREEVPPRTHVFIEVSLGAETWFVDVGVGGLSLTSALRLVLNEPQPTPHEPRRLTFEGGRYFHQAQLEGEWVDVCEFTREEMPEIDRELANWFTSAHPRSHFKNRLLAARALGEGRVTLLNRQLTRRQAGAVVERRHLTSPDELLEVLNSHFGLRFSAGTRFVCPALDW
jgi:N-hydroxyarylamine O-acetyltransferase